MTFKFKKKGNSVKVDSKHSPFFAVLAVLQVLPVFPADAAAS